MNAGFIFLVVGFLLIALGIGLVSIPAACVVSGLILFVSGGLELRLQTHRRPPS